MSKTRDNHEIVIFSLQVAAAILGLVLVAPLTVFSPHLNKYGVFFSFLVGSCLVDYLFCKFLIHDQIFCRVHLLLGSQFMRFVV